MALKRSAVYEAIARSLREFGYPDVTPEMIDEIHTAYREGKRDADLPYGIVGQFAQSQIEEAGEMMLL